MPVHLCITVRFFKQENYYIRSQKAERGGVKEAAHKKIVELHSRNRVSGRVATIIEDALG